MKKKSVMISFIVYFNSWAYWNATKKSDSLENQFKMTICMFSFFFRI